MMHTFITCDWCGEVPTKDALCHTVRIREMLHDFCDRCFTELLDKLGKSGRPVPIDLSYMSVAQTPYYTNYIPSTVVDPGNVLTGTSIGAQVPGSNLTTAGSTATQNWTSYNVSMGVIEPGGGTGSTGSGS